MKLLHDEVIALCFGDPAQRDKIRDVLAPYVYAYRGEPDCACTCCGVEDSETANGCNLCHECEELVTRMRSGIRLMRVALAQMEISNPQAKVGLACIATYPDGGGQVGATFEAEEFFDDIGMLLDHVDPAQPEEAEDG